MYNICDIYKYDIQENDIINILVLRYLYSALSYKNQNTLQHTQNKQSL